MEKLGLLCALPMQILLLSTAVDGLKILQVTDFHLDLDYDVHGDPQKMCHVSASRSRRTMLSENAQLGNFGDYMCDSPKNLISFSLSEAQRLTNPPNDPLDLILWTGDNTPHIDDYSMEYVVNAIGNTSSILFDAFPNTPILPTFGNHDYAPANAFVSASDLYSSVFKIWSSHIMAGGPDNEKLFKLGGYYKYDLGKTAKILVLNTNLYYAANEAYSNFSDPNDPAEQFAFMESELAKAQNCSTNNCISTIHIVAHIAPGAFERTPNITWFRPEYNERFLQITAKYASTIGWMIFGHHHTDTFHIVRDENDKPVQLLLMAPAVTPWFSDLPGAGSNNPSFRLFDTDDESQKYREIVTYAINLDGLNAGRTPHFSPLYSFTLGYGLKEITAQSMDDLITRMKADDSLFNRYIGYNSVMKDVKMPVGQYRLGQFCSMQYSSYAPYNECLQTAAATTTVSTTTESSGHTLTLLYFISILIAIAMRL